jgi:hypothetical protein
MTSFEVLCATANLLKTPAVAAAMDALEVVHEVKGLHADEVPDYVFLSVLCFAVKGIATDPTWSAERDKLAAHGIDVVTVIEFGAALEEAAADLLA